MGFASRCIVFLAIFAFALQTYIVQTHIHNAAHGAAASARTLHRRCARDKAPLDNSPHGLSLLPGRRAGGHPAAGDAASACCR